MKSFKFKKVPELSLNQKGYFSPRAATTLATTRPHRYNFSSTEKEEITFDVTPEELIIEDFCRK